MQAILSLDGVLVEKKGQWVEIKNLNNWPKRRDYFAYC